MPIRLCQKCGLKVLIDESQAGTNPFYCQRCTTAMKGQENAPAPGPITPVRNPTPSPMANRSDPAAPSVGAAKPATVRVLCPYCKASFNGRVPTKPARGSCPVCQKELILLPNGDIKPAAGFDLNTYSPGDAAAPAPEPAVPEPPKESGTRLLVKKYAAEAPPPPPPPAARPAAKRSEPVSAPAETDVSEEAGALPNWLDESASAGAPLKAPPETDVNLDVVEPKKDDFEDRTIKVEDPPPPPPPPARARGPVVAKMPSMASGRPPAAVPPPPPPAPDPEPDLLPEEPPPPKKQLGRVPSGERRAPVAAPAPAGEPVETGSGKVFLALILALLPVAACAGMLASMDKLHNDLVKKVGVRFSKGFVLLHQKMFPPPPVIKPKVEEKKPEPEPVKEEPPKVDPDQQHKDEIAISHLADECRMLRRKVKDNSTAASPEQQAEYQKVRDDLAKKDARIKQMREMYQKMYGKDYDPDKQ